MKKSFSMLMVLAFAIALSACSKQKPLSNTSPTPTPSQETTAPQSTTAPQPSSMALKRYGVESGMITYELSGVKTGTKTLYWDQWGMREATYTESTLTAGGMTISDNSVTIMDGDTLYTYKPGEKTGTKIQNTILQEIAEGSGNKDMGEVGYEMLKRMGGVKSGTDTVAGQTCDVYDVKSLQTSSCVWNAITLRVVSTIAGIGINETATKISTGSVPSEKLAIPTDVRFENMGNALDMLKKY